MDKSSFRCKICGNPQISPLWTGSNPQTAVCDWTCASILNSKLIYVTFIVATIGVLGSFLISYWFLILFIPMEIFGAYSLYLILRYRSKKEGEDRLKFVGEEDQDQINRYTR